MMSTTNQSGPVPVMEPRMEDMAMPLPAFGAGDTTTQAPKPRRNTAFFSPPPDIYLNRTVITTPAGELSLEDLFHEVDSNADGRISAMHELPVALTVMGLHWDEELGFALLADRAGVDTLEAALSRKCREWWSDEAPVSSGASVQSPESAFSNIHSPTSPTVPNNSINNISGSSSDQTQASPIVATSNGDAASKSPKKVPPPPPPRPRSFKLAGGAIVDATTVSPPMDSRRISVCGPVEDRSVDWTTFCTIVALLQASGAYKMMVRAAVKRKAEATEQSKTANRRNKPHSREHTRKSDSERERRRQSLNEKLTSFTGVEVNAPLIPLRSRSRSDADSLPKSPNYSKSPKKSPVPSLPLPTSTPGATRTQSMHRSSQSSLEGAVSGIFRLSSARAALENNATRKDETQPAVRAIASMSDVNSHRERSDKEAVRRMTQLLKARSALGSQLPFSVQPSTSPVPSSNASHGSRSPHSRSRRASRPSFTDIVEAAMLANGIGKKNPYHKGIAGHSPGHSPANRMVMGMLAKDSEESHAGKGSVSSIPLHSPAGVHRGQSSLPPMSPSTAVGAIFRHSSLRRLTRSPANRLVLQTGSSPVSSASTNTSNLSPHPSTITPTSTKHASTPTAVSFRLSTDQTLEPRRPSKFNFDMVPANDEVLRKEDPREAAPPQHDATVATATRSSSSEGENTRRSIEYAQRGSTSNMSAISESVSESNSSPGDGSVGTAAAPAHAVFLGGACNPTVWRKTIAIPFLERHDITYYNPQVDDWHPGLVLEEAKAKDEADVVLFVVGPETRAVASMIEVAELISCHRPVVLVLQDVPKDCVMNGHALQPDEIKDLNRGRAYLANVADRHGVTVYQSIDAALDEVASMVEERNAERRSGTSEAAHSVRSMTPESVVRMSPHVENQQGFSIARRPSRRHMPRMSAITAISTVTSLDADDDPDMLDDIALENIEEHEEIDFH